LTIERNTSEAADADRTRGSEQASNGDEGQGYQFTGMKVNRGF